MLTTRSAANLDSDQPVESFGRLLPPETIRRLSTLRPWVAVAHVVLEWALIIPVIWASYMLFRWNVIAGILGYVVAWAWIGARQHALAILMHEGAHYRLFRRRWLNDLFAELFAAWPVMISVRAYRQHHFAHHRSPNTDDDPDWLLRDDRDWEFPKTRWGLVKVFLFDILGLNVRDEIRFFNRYFYPRGRKTWLDYLSWVYYGTLLAVLTYFALWPLFLAYWIVPLLTSLKAVLRMRTIAEHYGLEYDHPFRQTRTTYPGLLGKLLFGPKNITLHLDHHLYPSVPFYNLPELHRELLQVERFSSEAHLTRTYRQVLRECLNCEPTPLASSHRN
jgi:fatty acid desaturase